MTAHEFYEWLNKQPYEDKIVRLRFRYSFENSWFYSNELLICGGEKCGDYEWLNDWDERYDRVEILGCMDVRDIPIPTFSELEEMQNNAAKELVDALGKVFLKKETM